MRKLSSLLYKDILLLMRDKAGLLLLFLMPLYLVLIMTLLQDNTYRTLQENRIRLAILNKDNDSLGTIIIRELRTSKMFNVDVVKTEKDAEKKIREKVASGSYQLGLIIPDSSTFKIKQSVKIEFDRHGTSGQFVYKVILTY